jgi:hypothetical protein
MNQNKDHLPLDKSLSRNTKLFVLLAIVMVSMSYIFQNRDTAIVIGSVVALFAVMLVDYFELLSKHHPQTWRVIKYTIIAIILLLTLIGFVVGV